MSRGFVKEDDQEETPMVPPRADLPEGLMNYVTSKGYDELLAEKEALIKEREDLEGANEKERRIASNLIHAKIQLLNERISSAQIIDLSEQPKDEVRFGATVSLKIGKANQVQRYHIVGVDEADISKKKMAFNSPIALLLMGKKVGEKAILKLLNGERKFEVIDIEYV
ncbi:GreA/GreB family elongation factor [Acidiluteibacter ferrifornacis]|uniref:Transcription elongation factor GreA n=1 Tax=Acidiluteibacter ferrifornacis TaxID=2692424 RepID=A0A6N9NKN5_9FLAO|nr:GreA/GreB family elongation factor [Acidiluteibacter ferrifornacis]NBG66434.1 transcription elongation factor GreA [Acidiluteibacter ferrifornacis]